MWRKMKGSSHRTKIYHAHYFCTAKGCTAKPRNIKKLELEKEYKKLLNDITPESEIIELAGAISLDVWNKSISDLEGSQKTLEKEIATREKSMDEYINLIPKTNSDLVKKSMNLK